MNRLMAGIHQNDGANSALPSFPHRLGLRIGDDVPIDGVHGRLYAQLGVPLVHLFHGVDDRFRIELGVRARFVPDAGSEPLPEVIHGTVQAEYRLEDIDPHCLGYGKDAGDYIWFRVVDESITFSGVALGDADEFGVAVQVRQQDAVDRIERQLRYMLNVPFVMRPQPVSQRFRRGSMVSLNTGGASAVAVPLIPDSGSLQSIDRVFTEGDDDFAVAVSAEYIISMVQLQLDALKAGAGMQVTVSEGPVDATWNVGLTDARATWSNGGIDVHIGGHGHTATVFADFDFDLDQRIDLWFDDGKIVPSAGARKLTVTSDGLLSDVVGPGAHAAISAEAPGRIQATLDSVSGMLDMGSRLDELDTQLKKLDDKAKAWWGNARFGPEGVVVGGWVTLAARRKPVAAFAKTPEGDGFTALESWIPGGRVDRLDWSWSFAGNGASGSESNENSFQLRHPSGHVGKFGIRVGADTPLPGLDGWGRVCLKLSGVRVNQTSGELEPVQSALDCRNYNPYVRVAGALLRDANRDGTILRRRLYLRDWRLPRGADPGHRELGLIDASGLLGPAANTLVIHGGEGLTSRAAEAIRGGLAGCTRTDAGLVVLVLYGEGALASAAAKQSPELRELAGGLEAPLLVNEDVQGGWSQALSLPASGEPAWRLLGSTGGITWAHDGEMTAEELAHILDAGLFTSAAAFMEPVAAVLDPGRRIQGVDLVGLVERRCPPPPVGKSVRDSIVGFLHPGSDASRTALREVADSVSANGDAAATLYAVVEGATRDEAERFTAQAGEHVLAVPDPSGAIADRFGISYWPTTLTIDRTGLVTAQDLGAARRAAEEESGAA